MKILISLFLSVFLNAQSNLLVKYKMTTLFDGSKNYNSELLFSENASVFEFKLTEKDAIDKEYNDQNNILKVEIPDKSIHKLFFDIDKATISEIKKKINSESQVLVIDSLELPIWKITIEKRKINNHECIKALTSFKGRDYEVWITMDFPTFFGPWKLNGLPGLILEAHDNKNEVFFEAIEIISTDKSLASLPTNLEITSSKDYNKKLTEYLTEITDRLNSLGDRNSKINSKATISKGIELE